MTQRAKVLSVPAMTWQMRLAGGLLALTAAAFAHAARADGGKVIVSHGISTFGELKYPAGFTHLDYVNPEAPKGGEISQRVPGTFDSMNPYSVGEATASYLHDLLRAEGLAVTRLAQGLPAGGGLDHADELTLYQALHGRRTL